MYISIQYRDKYKGLYYPCKAQTLWMIVFWPTVHAETSMDIEVDGVPFVLRKAALVKK